MSKLLDWIRLIRPLNVAIAAVAVGIGASVGPHDGIATAPLLWAALCTALITAGGNALNDVADIAIDRVNKPDRPVAGGRIPVRAAAIAAWLLLISGLAASLALPGACRMIALGAAALVCYYDLRAKGRPLLGNLIVAGVSGWVFPFASLAVGHGWWGWIPGVLAFFFHLGREIVKDLEDADADSAGGLRTLPLQIGESGARRIAQGVLLALLIFLPVPALAGWLGPIYLPIALAGVGLPVAVLIVMLFHARAEGEYRRYQLILKWDMLIGLLAVFAGG